MHLWIRSRLAGTGNRVIVEKSPAPPPLAWARLPRTRKDPFAGCRAASQDRHAAPEEGRGLPAFLPSGTSFANSSSSMSTYMRCEMSFSRPWNISSSVTGSKGKASHVTLTEGNSMRPNGIGLGTSGVCRAEHRVAPAGLVRKSGALVRSRIPRMTAMDTSSQRSMPDVMTKINATRKPCCRPFLTGVPLRMFWCTPRT
jgi:hypothetical protein